MSAQAQDLARRFTEMNDAIIAKVEQRSAAQWRVPMSGEGWALGMAAYHLALIYDRTTSLLLAAAAGHSLPPISREIIEERNVQDAREHADCTKEETLTLPRENGRKAAEALGGLSDEQLQRTTASPLFGRSWTTAELAEVVVLGHAQGHLTDFQAAR